MTPMELLLSQRRDKATSDAFAQGLRGKKDLAALAMLSGDQTVGGFGGVLQSDVANQVQQKLKRDQSDAQRELTQGYYNTAAENQRLSRALQKARLDETIRHNKAMEGRSAASAENKIKTDVRNLSRDLTKANIPEIGKGIALINQELEKYKDRDIPGLGGLSNVAPGMSEEARDVKSMVGRIRNIILKARSGGAVTPQEADRLLEEFQLGVFSTDEGFRNAWADFQDIFSSGVANVYAGYDDTTVDTYMQNLERQAGEEAEEEGMAWDEMTRKEASSTPTAPKSNTVDWNEL